MTKAPVVVTAIPGQPVIVTLPHPLDVPEGTKVVIRKCDRGPEVLVRVQPRSRLVEALRRWLAS